MWNALVESLSMLCRAVPLGPRVARLGRLEEYQLDYDNYHENSHRYENSHNKSVIFQDAIYYSGGKHS